jgi:hypothetical protein
LTATRSATGTPAEATDATNVVTGCLAGPTLHPDR